MYFGNITSVHKGLEKEFASVFEALEEAKRVLDWRVDTLPANKTIDDRIILENVVEALLFLDVIIQESISADDANKSLMDSLEYEASNAEDKVERIKELIDPTNLIWRVQKEIDNL